jgi:hypothetical protein
LTKTAEMEPMAERKPASATIKIDPDLLRKARQFTTMEDIKLQDYIDRLLRAPIERDHARMMKRLLEDAKRQEDSE